MQDNKKEVALYVRVSKDVENPENQLRELRRYASQKKWIISDEYIDITCGADTSRPELNRLFKDANKLKFDVLLFWALDRFSRAGVLHTHQKLNELEKLGIEWESYKEQYLRSAGPFKDATVSIMATLAKLEREKISDRVIAGLKRARAEGKDIGRPRISSYKINMINKLKREGAGPTEIAEKLGLSYSTVYGYYNK